MTAERDGGEGGEGVMLCEKGEWKECGEGREAGKNGESALSGEMDEGSGEMQGWCEGW